jgi:hypothetical protein
LVKERARRTKITGNFELKLVDLRMVTCNCKAGDSEEVKSDHKEVAHPVHGPGTVTWKLRWLEVRFGIVDLLCPIC